MTFVVPCARPENDPDDWFIDKTGRQYADEPVLTEVEEREIALKVEDLMPPPSISEAAANNLSSAINARLVEAETEKVRQALIRRRRAKDACFVDCILREHCLEVGLEMPHGTFGGYYEEERRAIVRARDRRQRRLAEGAGE